MAAVRDGAATRRRWLQLGAGVLLLAIAGWDISNARSIRTTSRRTDIASRPQGSSSHRTDTLSRTRAPTAPSVDSDQAAFGSHPC